MPPNRVSTSGRGGDHCTEPVGEVPEVAAKEVEKGSRREAREMALRALYVIEMRACSAREAVSDEMVNEGRQAPQFTYLLVDFFDKHRDRIDDILRNHIDKWEFHRLAMMDRLILRLGASEMLYCEEIPPKVTINEMIEIAKRFSTESSGRFVNGVLDSVFDDLRNGRIGRLKGGGETKVSS